MILGRDICGDLGAAMAREWLVTNGIGGYASGTVPGAPSRGYHGLLIAALEPQPARTLLAAALLEEVEGASGRFELATLNWTGGVTAPQGHRWLDSFRLEGAIPTWRWACGGDVLEKRVWMEAGQNITRVEYRLVRGAAPVRLTLKALVDHRDHHARTTADSWQPEVVIEGPRVRVTAFPGATPLHLEAEGAEASPGTGWFRGFDLPRERERGLQDHQDHHHAATFTLTLAPGASVQVTLSAGAPAAVDRSALQRAQARERGLLDAFARGHAAAPDWVRQLVLAADQFVIRRGEAGHSVIAGYHWFADWGRDTMISLPGLTLTTGRPDIARSVLLTFANFVDQGMLPNRFPDGGERPEYNTVDATLWYFDAIRKYHARTKDDATLRTLLPVMADIIAWHMRGTRYGIALDPRDGLLRAGEPGAQLTWMDARVDGREITPRIGKPVEVNALWYNALRVMAESSARLGQDASAYASMAHAARDGFARFWNPVTRHCFDVLDGPAGDDATLRPNQILAASLRPELLALEQRLAILDACERELLGPCGLRSLAPAHPDYRGTYGGDSAARDGSYHQGPVWGWLAGPFLEAHLAAGGSLDAARQRLEAMGREIHRQGIGTLNEIYEGDAPHAPRGCIAQAWSVAECLRAWEFVQARGEAAP
jgi:predicted glycogen debranching enzyme